MADTKPIFRVIDIAPETTAEQLQTLLNNASVEGYALKTLTPTRAVFYLPAKRVNGQWVREG
jgi:hypothetical protein